MATEILGKGIAGRTLPLPTPDGMREGTPVILDRYGKMLSPIFTKHPIADEGGYFTTTSTPGASAIAYGIIAAFSDTAAFIVIQNTDTPVSAGGTGKRIYLDFLRFQISVIPASSTQAFAAVKVDSLPRVPTAQNTLFTPTNVNIDTSVGSIAKVWFPAAGTITVPASGNARTIHGNILLRAAIPVVLDELGLVFGLTDITPAPATFGGANQLRLFAISAPIVIGPQEFALIHLWFPGNITTAASFAYIDMAHWER